MKVRKEEWATPNARDCGGHTITKNYPDGFNKNLVTDVAKADTSCRKSRKPKAGNRRKSSVGGSEELANATRGRCQQRQPKRQADKDACVVDQGKRHEAEPELGGTADGTAGGLDTTPGPLVNRVDRLRLLGKGVVNQTAAKAFATLSARLDKHLKV